MVQRSVSVITMNKATGVAAVCANRWMSVLCTTRLHTNMMKKNMLTYDNITNKASFCSTATPVSTSEPTALTREQVSSRVLESLNAFLEKRNLNKTIKETSNFQKEVGLDSLDIVEAVLAVEEEFGIEIPDADADRIQSPVDAIEYILKQPNAQ